MVHNSTRREFLTALVSSSLATLGASTLASAAVAGTGAAVGHAAGRSAAPGGPKVPQGKPRSSEFVFTRLRYTSGDWDFNPKVAANVLNSIVEYTTIPVYGQEVIITADSKELFAFPFIFMTGHKLVRFSRSAREALARYVEQGGLLFSDDCNHDLSGLYAQSFEQEMRTIFPARSAAMVREPVSPPPSAAVGEPFRKIPNTHPLYRAFFKFPDGPPQTSHELNGWGDDMVHDYLKAIEANGRIGVLYSNKDYGCEWDYEWKNKRFQRDDNTKFAVNLVTYAMTT